MDTLKWYIDNRPIYKNLAYKVEGILTEILELENIPFHMIQARAKEIESFSNKISGDKYSDPINQIQDYAGIRVITYVEDEVVKVSKIIEEIFKVDKANSSDKSDSLGIDKVGYKSVHYIAHLKADRLELPENIQFKDKCFEIQIRTILQHAWAEIEHDRNYKFSGILPKEINRRFKLLAGTLELADREFNTIANDIDKISTEVKSETQKGNFDIEINSTSFSEYIRNRFEKINGKYGFASLQNDGRIVRELKLFGISTLKDFEDIIPKKFEDIYIKSQSSVKSMSGIGIIRMILIIVNSDRYFQKAHNSGWSEWSTKGNGKDIFDHYGVDWKVIKEKYGVSFT